MHKFFPVTLLKIFQFLLPIFILTTVLHDKHNFTSELRLWEQRVWGQSANNRQNNNLILNSVAFKNFVLFSLYLKMSCNSKFLHNKLKQSSVFINAPSFLYGDCITPFPQFKLLYLQLLIWLYTDSKGLKWRRRSVTSQVLTQLSLMAYCTNSNMPLRSQWLLLNSFALWHSSKTPWSNYQGNQWWYFSFSHKV